MKHTYNGAQQLLIAIGGTAAMVAGFKGVYYPDHQTPKKEKRLKIGAYGEIIRAKYANERKAVLEAKRS